MTEVIDVEKPVKGVRFSARGTIRPDYHRQPKISYAEAGLIAGVSVRTIEDWVYRKRNPLPRCACRGAFLIDRLELDKYLRKGLK